MLAGVISPSTASKVSCEVAMLTVTGFFALFLSFLASDGAKRSKTGMPDGGHVSWDITHLRPALPRSSFHSNQSNSSLVIHSNSVSPAAAAAPHVLMADRSPDVLRTVSICASPDGRPRYKAPAVLPLAQCHTFEGRKQLFSKEKFAHRPFNQRTRAFAEKVLRVDLSKRSRNGRTVTIAGKVDQHKLASYTGWTPEMREEWNSIVREFAAEVGLSSAIVQGHHVVSETLLVANQNDGEQHPHLDADLGAAALENTFSVVLYCTDFVESTAMPVFSKSEFAVPEYEPGTSIVTDESKAAMKKTVEAHLFERSAYHTIQVQAGDMMIFAQSTPHFGTQNPLSSRRVAVFSILSPSEKDGQDDFQLFRWLYVERCFGVGSAMLAKVLYLERQHDPMGHCPATPDGRRTKADFMSTLLQWRYITLTVAATSHISLAHRNFLYLPEHEHGRQLSGDDYSDALRAMTPRSISAEELNYNE